MPNLYRFLFGTAAVLLSTARLHAQTLTPVPSVSFDTAGPILQALTSPAKPFTVAGQHGILVGQQDGVFESWVLPVKLLSHFTIEASVEGYGVPIDLNQQSASIEVRPDRTVITYSHPAFTVRQMMFSPAQGDQSKPGTGPAETGPIVLFEFDCLRPTNFTFRFTPELKWMWPERNEGAPGPEWVSPDAHNPTAAGGFYVLHTDYPNLAAAVTIPGAQPGILAPYQEHPQIHPLELRLHIDPIQDQKKLFPLLMAAGITPATATNAALAATLAQLNAQIPALYEAHAKSWKNLLSRTTSIETPDQALNEAFQWAVISIEQLKTRTLPGQSSPPSEQCHPERSTPGAPCEAWGKRNEGSAFVSSAPPSTTEAPTLQGPPEETALVAGYFTSADSARPGFGWFFGRDALYTLYAVDGYGDFALAKSELEFLIHRQRADGKIMHEYSQTAAAIDWQAFPYMYAAADSTPLFLLAVADYVRSSGDTSFLTEHRDAIEKAWAFETDPAHDTDHDGIYDNSQGTGWVESWPGGMPHQEIYLALLDQQASAAMAFIERQLHDSSKAEAAGQRAEAIAKPINAEYADAEKGCYAFSHNADGTNDRTTTIYPALAWWDPAPGQPLLQKGEECLRHFASATLNTDWGTRDVADTEKIYDGLSYHQGSVWPLFTGWAALAEYRGNQPLAGYQLLMENANLTRAQDLGAVTELLSGDFFVPFGRSTSHQLWSSAMVITPTLRGLFGISIDAQSKTITVNPHLPAGWGSATIKNLPVGSDTVDLLFSGPGSDRTIRILGVNPAHVKLATFTPGARQVAGDRIEIPGPGVEVAPVIHAPLPGARSESVRVLSQDLSGNRLTLTLEGPAGSQFRIPLVVTAQLREIHVNGAELQSPSEVERRDANVPSNSLSGHFPPGPGFQTLTVTLTW
jgi:glycogen debranching enzyme